LSVDRSTAQQIAARPNYDAGPEAQQITDSRQITARDGLYVGLRYGVGILIGLANMFVLTWWIGPHAYGLFVAAIGLSAFLGSLTRAGADTYLIRRQNTPDTRLYSVATTLILATCSVLVLLGLAAVPALIHWYGSQEFALPYAMTLITVPLTGVAGPPIAKLERELNFRNAAGIELAGQLLAFGVSALLAWRHFGVWAPIAGVIVSQTWVAIAAHVAAGLIPQLVWDFGEVRAMLSFGLGYTLSLRVWQLRGLVNPLLVGRLLGADAVAFVALAVRIAESLGFLRAVAGRLAIVGLSRMRGDRDRFRAAIQRGLELQVLALGPLLCVFAAIAPIAVNRLFGARWALSLQVYPWIAAAIVINSVFNLQASALYVLGEQWTVLRAYCAHMVLFASGAYFLVSRVGLRGYGWADLVACASYWLLHRTLGKHTHISYRRVGAGCIAFGLPLFTHIVTSWWNWILWLPFLLLLVLQLGAYSKRLKAEILPSERADWFFKRSTRSLEASQP